MLSGQFAKFKANAHQDIDHFLVYVDKVEDIRRSQRRQRIAFITTAYLRKREIQLQVAGYTVQCVAMTRSWCTSSSISYSFIFAIPGDRAIYYADCVSIPHPKTCTAIDCVVWIRQLLQ